MPIVIADTGFVVAIAIETDSRHEDCKAVYAQYPDILLPQTVLAEVAYLLERSSGNEGVAEFWQV